MNRHNHLPGKVWGAGWAECRLKGAGGNSLSEIYFWRRSQQCSISDHRNHIERRGRDILDKKETGDTSEDFRAFHKHKSKPGKASRQDFPGGPAVKNLPCNIGDMSSTPGQETQIPQALGSPCHNESLRATTKILHAPIKTQCSQINKYFKKNWAQRSNWCVLSALSFYAEIITDPT